MLMRCSERTEARTNFIRFLLKRNYPFNIKRVAQMRLRGARSNGLITTGELI